MSFQQCIPAPSPHSHPLVVVSVLALGTTCLCTLQHLVCLPSSTFLLAKRPAVSDALDWRRASISWLRCSELKGCLCWSLFGLGFPPSLILLDQFANCIQRTNCCIWSSLTLPKAYCVFGGRFCVSVIVIMVVKSFYSSLCAAVSSEVKCQSAHFFFLPAWPNAWLTLRMQQHKRLCPTLCFEDWGGQYDQ